MTVARQVYKCNVCGNIVEVLDIGAGELVCCDEPMQLQDENTVDAAREKHVPVIEKTDGSVKVKVGSVAHPMDDKHWIEWIEVIADGKSCRQVLKPGQPAEAVFAITAKGDYSARVLQFARSVEGVTGTEQSVETAGKSSSGPS